MAGYENIKDYGFDKRTAGEQREIAVMGGKASGKSRRRTADMRKVMNRLLTMKADVEGLSDILLADGGESTYEEIISMAMIEQAANGNVSAFNAIREIIGQTTKSESDLESQKADIELKQARKQAVTGEKETDVTLDKLDEILKGVYENASKQEAE